jgi:N-sulfoglucosamine sulfohydrolase
MRNARYKYLRNLFSELEFPFASDLFESKTWQSIRAAGETGTIGRRKASRYLHRSPEELYDIKADPDELNNLADQPQHRAALDAMRSEVKAFQQRTKDGWLINDNYK